jgi:hypothetical protein
MTSMNPFYSDAEIAKLNVGRDAAQRTFASLRERYLMRRFEDARAAEHARNGFARRLGTLIRALNLVFDLLPPELDTIADRDTVVDATISIQSFVLNTFGCLDNLAWTFVHEKGVTAPSGAVLDPRSVSIGSAAVRARFSNEFSSYVDSRAGWLKDMRGFRDSLVHRIPLYIPPFIVTPDAIDEYNRLERASDDAMRAKNFEEYSHLQKEQTNLGRFRPWMTHSLTENSPAILFHPQLLSDFATVDEFGREMLEELGR